ncbi:MAG: hypothetical protein QXW83_00705 [Nitrososphaerales archaeon]
MAFISQSGALGSVIVNWAVSAHIGFSMFISLGSILDIDYDREMAFIAETREGDRRIEIGVGRLILEPNRKRGEFAVVVADKYQRKGLQS